MKKKVLQFLRAALPFLAVLVLWRLAVPLWNPGGILAIIPIFYYSFIRPTPWFAPYAVLFCFLIDYTSDTLLYWTTMYCVVYAAIGFQNFIDLTRWDGNGLRAFMLFFCGALLILFFSNLTWGNLGRLLWTALWGCVLYTPIIGLIGDRHDR